jgi:hypothetical protein
MSTKFPGGIISKTPPVPSGAFENSTAPGVWTLEQQAAYAKLGQWPTAGNTQNFIEDVFSTYLYTGNGSTQTITNGIDLSTKGGLVWIKRRTGFSVNHYLNNTVQGTTQYLSSNTTTATQSISGLTAFNTNGFTLGSDNIANGSSENYASWTWRKQPKYFDIQTWTGTGSNTTISHALGSVPACIMVKRTDTTGAWQVYHRSLANTEYLVLNTTAAKATGATRWNSTTPTSTVFSLGTDATVNASGGTYVAYIFAHDAGGFGLTGTDNVISCASYTGNGSATGPVITLGYEPQLVMIKRSDSTADWYIFDSMRGIPMAGDTPHLLANTSGLEASGQGHALELNATGFSITNTFGATNASGGTYIYIAIRRGPMKVPTVGTKVYYPFARAGNDTQTDITGVGFTPDLWMVKSRNIAADFPFFDRLRGVTKRVVSNATNAEESFSGSNGLVSLNMDGITIGAGALDGGICNDTGTNYGNWLLKRAPSFFDEVCYTGAGTSATTFSHNLQKQPELIIVKSRNAINNWAVAAQTTGSNYIWGLDLNTTAASQSPFDYGANMSATIFDAYIGTAAETVNSGTTYVAYLFATCAGVSKVGSYTGNGTTQTINCGFTGGARFVLIKRTDSTGDWYVYDTARGMTVLTDPYLLLNSTAAESATLGSVTTVSTGFALNSTILAAINASGGTYIFLAIA